jgi:regulator of protease activity HflC (stomatin/prohibitin superfamily)
VEKFGKYDKILPPGLGFAGCDVCGACVSFRAITSRVEQNLCKVQTKTKDNVFVTVNVAVQQSVVPERVEDAIYKLTNVHAQVDSYVSDVVRSHVPKMTLDEAFEKKDEISDAVQEQLAKNMAAYGFQIHKALVTELQPDASVQASMNEINKQRRLRDASIMAAEADKIKVVKAAEAAADAAHLQGQGIARQRSAIIDGLKESITSGTGSQLTSDKVSELLLITQYFETLRDIGATSKAQTIFIPHSAGAIADVSSQIRNGVLQASAPSQGRM